ncbi:TPA: protein translocase subunit SecD [Candidatus Uhrbacteria bacterium]|nr:protein translocase subunit SecD [Candidatus Uhrbacteria bacterium]
MAYKQFRKQQKEAGKHRQINASVPSKWRLPAGVLGILVLSFIGLGYLFPVQWNATIGKTGLEFQGTPFHLGLDLLGGAHLVYEADVSQIGEADRADALRGVRDVIERRVNAFGVAEPIVQLTGDTRIIVELAGIQDINEAIGQIGETPILEFKRPVALDPSQSDPLEGITVSTDADGNATLVDTDGLPVELNEEMLQALQGTNQWENTELSGAHLKHASVEFDANTGTPLVALTFDTEGGELFGKLTEELIGQQIAIFLDGSIISSPVVQDAIYGGQAQITGSESIEEARTLAQRLNAGALPVPIELISQQTVGPTLGAISLERSLLAGAIGLALIALFMVLYYRLPGLLAVVALVVYGVLVLSVFKLVPVTLTLAGIAGMVLSIGMAVDANVLIFERLKEEVRSGRPLDRSIDEAVKRAWSSIRDGNMTTLIACVILFGFSSSFIKGFALTLGIGVVVSMLTAVVVTRAFLALAARWSFLDKPFLYGVKKMRQ